MNAGLCASNIGPGFDECVLIPDGKKILAVVAHVGDSYGIYHDGDLVAFRSDFKEACTRAEEMYLRI